MCTASLLGEKGRRCRSGTTACLSLKDPGNCGPISFHLAVLDPALGWLTGSKDSPIAPLNSRIARS